MSKYVGIYKLKELQQMSIKPEGGLKLTWMTAEEYAALPAEDPHEAKEKQMMLGGRLIVKEDGRMLQVMEVPAGVTKEELDEAIASGDVTMVDGYIEAGEPKLWEEREDGFYTRTGVEGTIFDEATDPWVKSDTDEEGVIVIGDFAQIKFIKCE